MKYIKLFNQYSDYTEYEQSGNFTKPNVSYCIEQDEVYANAPSSSCQPSVIYELVGNPSYPSTIGANDTSFILEFVIKKTIITPNCEIIVSSEKENANIEVGANEGDTPRTITSSYTYNGVVIEYTVIQENN